MLLIALLFAKTAVDSTALSIWTTPVAVLAASSACEEPAPPFLNRITARSARVKSFAIITAALTIIVMLLLGHRDTLPISNIIRHKELSPLLPPRQDFAPLQLPASTEHPIGYLVESAMQEFTTLRNRQSRNLAEAAREYRRRYAMSPPPRFDQWFEFAAQNNVQLMDEYDAIHDALLPFWSFEPLELRNRVREALGYEANAFIAVSIRKGKVVRVEGGTLWQRNKSLGMIKGFVHYLPDMDIAFNIHDEPRVVVPHDELSRMIELANERLSRLGSGPLQNAFSPRPKDMDDGRRVRDAKETKFNEYPHQLTWVPSSLSCSVDSPARDSFARLGDNLTAYAVGELGFSTLR